MIFEIKSKGLNQKSWYKAAEESHYKATYHGFEKIIADNSSKVNENSNTIKIIGALLSLNKDSSAENKKNKAKN